MKQIIIKGRARQLVAVLLMQLIGVIVSAACAGCSTPGYLGNRARDAGDIFTATIGVGAGVKARIGPLATGLSYYRDAAGIRGGDAGIYRDRKVYRNSDLKGDCTIILCGGDHFETDVTGARGKTIDSHTPTAEVIPFLLTIPAPFVEVQRNAPTAGASYYTQIEGVLAVGGGVRLGFNPGELVDFILGWFTVDMFGDDSPESESEQSARAYPPPAARQLRTHLPRRGFRAAQP